MWYIYKIIFIIKWKSGEANNENEMVRIDFEFEKWFSKYILEIFGMANDDRITKWEYYVGKGLISS